MGSVWNLVNLQIFQLSSDSGEVNEKRIPCSRVDRITNAIIIVHFQVLLAVDEVLVPLWNTWLRIWRVFVNVRLTMFTMSTLTKDLVKIA